MGSGGGGGEDAGGGGGGGGDDTSQGDFAAMMEQQQQQDQKQGQLRNLVAMLMANKETGEPSGGMSGPPPPAIGPGGSPMNFGRKRF